MLLSESLAYFGVSLDSSETETKKKVKKAYRKLARKHHPDVGGNVKKFQEIQNAYDHFLNHLDKPLPIASRSVAILFFMFRDFVSAFEEGESFTLEELWELAKTPEEKVWLHEFVCMAEGASFLRGFRRHSKDVWSIFFFPHKITLPRFYRAYAIRCLGVGSPMFRLIEKMFLNELPWHFEWLKETLNARNV